MKKKILILTAGFGEGHNTAAKNLKSAFESLEGEAVEVQVFDLLDGCYGVMNRMLRKTYAMAIDRAPRLWQHFYDFLDHSPHARSHLHTLTRLHAGMEKLLLNMDPDAVVSTYPLYNYVIDGIFLGKRPRRFHQVTVVTDSISVNSIWYRCHSDFYILPNEESAAILRENGIAESRIRTLGFPVSLQFERDLKKEEEISLKDRKPKILWIINAQRKKAPKLLKKLLDSQLWDLTVCAGRDPQFYKVLKKIIDRSGEKVELLGWTDQMAELMIQNDIVISKAGGATVQESIAAHCPMILTKVVPGQEEGNYELLQKNEAGICIEKWKEIPRQLELLFKEEGAVWNQWKKNIIQISKPGASREIARFVVQRIQQESVSEMGVALEVQEPLTIPSLPVIEEIPLKRITDSEKRPLLCDFHTHTQFSDGKLTLSDLVDFYGERRFDVLCVTDHLCDPQRLLGKVCKWSNLVLSPEMLDDYFAAIQSEKQRAWDQYELLLMTGLEFNKDGYTRKTSAHLLGVDLQSPIDPSLSIPELIQAIQSQGGLAIASHPHVGQGSWAKETLYFWENIDQYAPILDAWEIANRDDIYNPVGLKRLSFIANSDFHKPKHIYSWKSLLFCEKNPESIKQCIRENRNLSITMYRDSNFRGSIKREG